MSTAENTLAGKIAFPFLCLFAFALAFSISVAQIGLAVVFLIFLLTMASRTGRSSLQFSGLGRLRIFYVFVLGWVFWRLFHVVISAQPVKELVEAREVWLMLIPLFVFLYASERKHLWTLATSFVMGVAVSSAFAAWQLRADIWNMVRGHGIGEMHHLNFAGMSALAIVIGMGLVCAAYFSGRKSRALVILLLTFCALLGLWFTKSRGVMAALVPVIPVYIYIQLFNRVQRVVLVVTLVVFGIILIPRMPDYVTKEFKFPAPEWHMGSQAERRDLWQAGWAMIQEKPVVGWGERGYNLNYGKYMVPGAYGVAAYDAKGESASHMHNDAINTWVLYGAVGLILQLLLYFYGVGVYLRERFKIRLGSDRALAAAAASSILLMAVMGITQCHYTSEIVQMSFWLCVGLLFTVLESDRAGSRTP